MIGRADKVHRDGAARIASRAVRGPWHRHRGLRFSLLAVFLFVTGVATGTGMGVWLAPTPPSAVVQNVNLVGAGPGPDLPEGAAMPVEVRVSTRALRLYEEDPATQPGDVRPDPDAAPPPVAALPSVAPPPSSSPPQTAAPRVEVPQPPAQAAPPIQAGRERWRRFAVQTSVDPEKPMIAVVIDDLGIDQPRSRRAIDLPAPVTLAFLPYGYNLRDMAADARAKGHEILVHVPMAPLDLGVDPGPNALQRELGAAENLRRLDWGLAQLEGYVGINNHMGSRFTAHGESMRLVIGELKRRGLLFMDSVTSTETQGYRLADRMGVAYAVRDVFLDHVVDPDFVHGQLQRTEETARRQGYAIAIGHPHDATLSALRTWMADATARGYQLVPLSAIVQHANAGSGS